MTKELKELIARLRAADANPSAVESWRDLVEQAADALEKMSGDAERLTELDKANVDLAAESSKLRGLLSDLVDAVDAMEDLDEMDGEAFSTNSAKLDAAVEAARPHTEAALLAAAKLRSALRALDET